jgi:tetratricopeptide (TPR) repeat protein
MNCISCGCEIGGEITCPYCGHDNAVLHKAVKISNSYYNKGLDSAQIRDMSGAIDMLERSLKFNKRNIDARNLLGLVYFETGEVVSALGEWVISKNIKPSDNIASEYIEKVRANQARLENIQQTIRRYNRALDSCKAGEDDIAAVMLKKVIDANPKLIKAYYLLALIHIKNGEFEKARRILKKALPIDRTNPTALRFLREIDEQTGTVTDTDDIRNGIVREGRKGLLGFLRRPKKEYRINNGYTTINWDDEENIITEPIVQPIAFHQLPAFTGILNLIIGIVLGAFIIGLIVVPAVRRGVSREADEQVDRYSETLVTQNAYIASLEDQIEEINAQVDSGNSDLQSANSSIEEVENLLDAYMFYADENFDEARSMLLEINAEILPERSRNIYDTILNEINTSQYDGYYDAGYEAFQRGDFAAAIPAFTNALVYRENDYASMAYLAHSYRLSGDADNARSVFENIAEVFPNTTRAATAQRYITEMAAGNMNPQAGIGTVNTEVTAGLAERVPENETPAEEAGEEENAEE